MTQRPDDAVPSRTGRHRALVVVAAGSGTRLGHGMPKAAVQLTERTMLDHALDAVTDALQLSLVAVVLPEDTATQEKLRLSSAEVSARCRADIVTVTGGPARTESVRAGVRSVQQHAERASWPGPVHVLVHDAARALTPTSVFQRVLGALDAGAESAIPALPVTDTIKRVDHSSHVTETLPRQELRAVQTPQGFTLDLLRRSFVHIGELSTEAAAALTDEAMIAEDLGESVAVVEGHPHALKITTSVDLLTARALIAESALNADGPTADSPGPVSTQDRSTRRSTPEESSVPENQVVPRVGIGHDIHAFAADGEAAELWVAGLHWPGERGLAGHSDADPVAHAACAALFSAAGMGDLGTHFGADTIGSSRAEYKGASGVVLLAEAARIVRDAGFRIGSVTVQFIANRPKFAGRRVEAEQVLSSAAGAPVAVSATTSDGLGFPGRGEGIMATATAVIY